MHQRYAAAVAALALILPAAFATAAPASAGQPPSTGCTFSVSPLVLRSYNTFSHAPAVIPLTLQFDCTGSSDPSNVTVRLLSNSSGSSTTRYMTDANGDRLYYSICLDAACQRPVGPLGFRLGGSRRGAMSLRRNAAGTQGTLALYGVVAAQQDVRVGSYGDTVVVESVP